jgi:hypothetical protein
MNRLAFLLFALAPGLFGQSLSSNFVIDKSKPFAYLVFDHIGPGNASSGVGRSERIFLRVVNNCRITILFKSEGPADAIPGALFEDEVIAEPQGIQVISDKEMESFEQKQRLREKALKRKPDGETFEVSGAFRVEPGKDALFSVPRSHVGPFWFLRVKFALDVGPSSVAVGPYTYLEFHNYEIPRTR